MFHQLQANKSSTLLSIIIMGAMCVAFYMVARDQAWLSPKDDIQVLRRDVENRAEIVATNYAIKSFKQLRYLQENGDFKDIAMNLRFVRVFDKARFGDLLIHMDKLQKVYMYILAGRYNPETHICIVQDLRKATLEILYSLYIIIPRNLQHSYGIRPHQEIKRSIDNFNVATRKMLAVLFAFGKANGFHVEDTILEAYEPNKDRTLP